MYVEGTGYRIGKILTLKNKMIGSLLYNNSNQDTVILSKGRDTDQWNWMENQKVDPYKYAEFIFDKSTKAIKWQTVFFNKWGWNKWTSMFKKCEPWSKAHAKN